MVCVHTMELFTATKKAKSCHFQEMRSAGEKACSANEASLRQTKIVSFLSFVVPRFYVDM